MTDTKSPLTQASLTASTLGGAALGSPIKGVPVPVEVGVALGVKYTCTQMLCKTIQGYVYLAVDAQHLKYAVKVVNKSRVYTGKSWDRPDAEIATLTSVVGCKHLQQLVETKETFTYILIITKYVPHGDLFDHITPKSEHNKDNPSDKHFMSEAEVKVIMRQIIAAMVTLQSKGLVYTDLSLENVAIEEVGSAKEPHKWNVTLIDLGAVMPIPLSPETFAIKFAGRGTIGKVAHRSPEVIEYATQTRMGDEATPFSLIENQVWMLGTNMFQLLTYYQAYEKYDDFWYRGLINGRWLSPSYIKRLEEVDCHYYKHVSPQLLQLMNRMFKPVPVRITFEELRLML